MFWDICRALWYGAIALGVLLGVVLFVVAVLAITEAAFGMPPLPGW